MCVGQDFHSVSHQKHPLALSFSSCNLIIIIVIIIRDLEAELLSMVCKDVELLQDITGEELLWGANTAPDARLDIVARGFWERQRSAFFMLGFATRMLTPIETWIQTRYSGNTKQKRSASTPVEVEQATFTPLVFSTTGGMAVECKRYHSRLAELVATKKGENYATTMSWIRAKVSFALMRLLCLRGSRDSRIVTLDLSDADLDIQKGLANIH